MLILTRHSGQTINIGKDIKVTVCGVRGGQVRIGVDAPKEITVDREEVTERKRIENRAKAAHQQGVVNVVRRPLNVS